MDDKDVPDYFCGRLIYFDDSEAMHYVVYDGVNQHRFATRQDAEKWCLQMVDEVMPSAIAECMRAYHHLTRASITLRELKRRYPMEESELLELISVNSRRLADKLDDIISKYITKL